MNLTRRLAERIFDELQEPDIERPRGIEIIERVIAEEAGRRRERQSVGGMIVDSFVSLFPRHDAGFTLTHNANRVFYTTTQQAIEEAEDLNGPESIEWATPTSRERCLATDSLWVLNWNPQTPVGSCEVWGATLEEVLRNAMSGDADTGGRGSEQPTPSMEGLLRACGFSDEQIAESERNAVVYSPRAKPVDGTDPNKVGRILGKPVLLAAEEKTFGVLASQIEHGDFRTYSVPVLAMGVRQVDFLPTSLTLERNCDCVMSPRVGEIGPCTLCNGDSIIRITEDWPLTEEAKAHLTERVGAELVDRIIACGKVLDRKRETKPGPYSNKSEDRR